MKTTLNPWIALMHSSSRWFVLALAALVAVTMLAAPAPALSRPAAEAPVRFVDAAPPDCTAAGIGEPVPESVSVTGVTDHGRTVNVDALVFLDVAEGVSIAREDDAAVRAKRLAALAAKVTQKLAAGRSSYAAHKINLRFDRFRLLAPLNADGSARTRTRDAATINALAKSALGGTRPAGIDVVFTATDLDVTDPVLGENLTGLADCVGGIRYPSMGFAVGEITGSEPIKIGPAVFYHQSYAKTMAHEIGHLLGAHHHYQECATGLAEGYEEGDVATPCTVMTNALDLQSLNFSAVEGAVVRGHAVDFAR